MSENKSTGKSLKVSLNEVDTEHIRKIAKKLGISESEVLRKGLRLMAVYANTYDDEKSRLILEDENSKTELMIL